MNQQLEQIIKTHISLNKYPIVEDLLIKTFRRRNADFAGDLKLHLENNLSLREKCKQSDYESGLKLHLDRERKCCQSNKSNEHIFGLRCCDLLLMKELTAIFHNQDTCFTLTEKLVKKITSFLQNTEALTRRE